VRLPWPTTPKQSLLASDLAMLFSVKVDLRGKDLQGKDGGGRREEFNV
jgi:hypothetical protein